MLSVGCSTAVFKKVATFNIDFASRDGFRTQKIAFRSYDSNFVRRIMEIEQIKHVDIQVERTIGRSKSRWLCHDFRNSNLLLKYVICQDLQTLQLYTESGRRAMASFFIDVQRPLQPSLFSVYTNK